MRLGPECVGAFGREQPAPEPEVNMEDGAGSEATGAMTATLSLGFKPQSDSGCSLVASMSPGW
jgi:hypothetical protein